MKVNGNCLLDTLDRNGLVVVASLQRNAVDVGLRREQKESLRNNACAAIADELKTHWACTHWSLRWWPIQTQVTAAIVVARTWVGACTYYVYSKFKIPLSASHAVLLSVNNTCFTMWNYA